MGRTEKVTFRWFQGGPDTEIQHFKWYTDFGFSQFGIPPWHKAGPIYDTLPRQFKSTQEVAPRLFTHWELYIHPATQAYCVGKYFCHVCTNKHYKVRYIRHKPEQREQQMIHDCSPVSKEVIHLFERMFHLFWKKWRTFFQKCDTFDKHSKTSDT